MKLHSRLLRAESNSAHFSALAAAESERVERAAMNEYLESLTVDELLELERAIVWKDADPSRTSELATLSVGELVTLYQQELRNGSNAGR